MYQQVISCLLFILILANPEMNIHVHALPQPPFWFSSQTKTASFKALDAPASRARSHVPLINSRFVAPLTVTDAADAARQAAYAAAENQAKAADAGAKQQIRSQPSTLQYEGPQRIAERLVNVMKQDAFFQARWQTRMSGTGVGSTSKPCTIWTDCLNVELALALMTPWKCDRVMLLPSISTNLDRHGTSRGCFWSASSSPVGSVHASKEDYEEIARHASQSSHDVANRDHYVLLFPNPRTAQIDMFDHVAQLQRVGLHITDVRLSTIMVFPLGFPALDMELKHSQLYSPGWNHIILDTAVSDGDAQLVRDTIASHVPLSEPPVEPIAIVSALSRDARGKSKAGDAGIVDYGFQTDVDHGAAGGMVDVTTAKTILVSRKELNDRTNADSEHILAHTWRSPQHEMASAAGPRHVPSWITTLGLALISCLSVWGAFWCTSNTVFFAAFADSAFLQSWRN